MAHTAWLQPCELQFTIPCLLLVVCVSSKKIETLITVQVHHRDVVGDLYDRSRQRHLTSTDDFEWKKQARFYWDPDGEDSVSNEGAVRVDITDLPFEYQYEFLGTKERLVITPLTDR